MGGRGAASGISRSGKAYGTEYETLLESGNIKFVRYRDSTSAKTPMETMTKGRVYVTVNHSGELKAITRYDRNNRRYKQIDLTGSPHRVNGTAVLPHSHLGYYHAEHGTNPVSARDRNLIDRVRRIWDNFYGRK